MLGALDLSKPGNLAKFMPKRPAVLVEAHDDIIVIDLMQNPKFASNERVRAILGTLTPVVNVSGMSTEGDFLIVQLRARCSYNRLAVAPLASRDAASSNGTRYSRSCSR